MSKQTILSIFWLRITEQLFLISLVYDGIRIKLLLWLSPIIIWVLIDQKVIKIPTSVGMFGSINCFMKNICSICEHLRDKLQCST